MAADQKTEPIKYWKITAEVSADIGMFHRCALPSMTLHGQEFKVWDGQGKPLPLADRRPGVASATCTLGRGVDTRRELWKWISKIAQKGATPTPSRTSR